MKTKKAILLATQGGSGSSTFRVTIPTTWIRKMELGEDYKNIKLSFDGEKITIENNEEEIKMLNDSLEKAKVEIEKEIEELGFIDDSDNTDRFLDELARKLVEKEILQGDVDIELYYENEDKIEYRTEELLEEIKKYMNKTYKCKGSTNDRGDYAGCYYKTKEGFKKWSEIGE